MPVSPVLPRFVEGLMFLHIACGLGCLAVGPWAMLARPKGGPRHRLAGRVWMRLMIALGVTAALLLCVRWNPFFFALSVLSFYLVFSGYRVLGRKRPHLNVSERARLPDYLAAYAALATGAASLILWCLGVFGPDAMIVLGTLGFAVAAAGADLWQFHHPAALPVNGLYLIEHLTKLSGAYIAVASAFSGTVLGFLPVALAQTWPALVGVPLLLFVASGYWRRVRRKP